MTFADKHELAMLRSTDKLMDDMVGPMADRSMIRQLLDMAFSQGALFVLEDDLHKLGGKHDR